MNLKVCQIASKLKKIDCKIIVSLQGNDYETIDSIKDYEVKIINQTNRGYGNALIEGINACNTKFFCIFNADGSFDENDLFKMYELNLDKDFVFTSRYKKNGGSDDDTLVTYIGNQIFSTLGRLLYSLKIDDILYTFLMGKTESFKKGNI